MGPIDKIFNQLKLLKAGKHLRKLYREGLVDANGHATKKGRTFAKRVMAEAWFDDEANVKKVAENLIEYTKLVKDEAKDEKNADDDE